jgi:hypothetical protein
MQLKSYPFCIFLLTSYLFCSIHMRMATKQSGSREKKNDRRTTDEDPKTTIGVSLRASLIQQVRERCAAEDVNFSAMITRLVRVGLASTPNP